MRFSLHALSSIGAALVAAGVVFANDVKVDVVVDFNAPGYGVVHPTADRPAYYFPLTIGYRTSGDVAAYEAKALPPPAEVEHMLAEALYKEGYRYAGASHPATLVLVLRWGIMGPMWNGRTEPLREGPHITSYTASAYSMAGRGSSANSGPPLADLSYDSTILDDPQYTIARHETREMLSLVGGDTFHDRHVDINNTHDPAVLNLLAMAREPRYYFMISAYGLKDWMDHYKAWTAAGGKGRPASAPTALWEAHVSTEVAPDRELAGVLPTLITAAAPYFGRETHNPRFIDTGATPAGTVSAGTPVLAPNQPARPATP